uniref:Uncharacterized protein n=1 Tax=Globisporangium ultimum (strain ATCC 200006 / CBS 805.95 / DAOM BR144) TaxID=431595 RepID=K3WGW5_GLOUD
MPSKNATLKLLVLSELDGQILRVNRLCERLVCSDNSDIDAILVSGGLVATRAPGEYEALEAVAAAEGDMMALISRLEMIICRVLYITDDNDPPTTRSLVVPAPTLTQYSSNVFYREQQVSEGVVVMGEAHYFKLLNGGKDPIQDHDLPSLHDPLLQSRLIEIVGGGHHPPHANAPLVFPGSFRQGQFMILELEKQSVDDSWHIARSQSHHLPFDDDDDF